MVNQRGEGLSEITQLSSGRAGIPALFLLLYRVASLCGAPLYLPSDRPQRINACQSGPFRVHQVTLGIAVSIQEPNQLPSTRSHLLQNQTQVPGVTRV